MIKSIVAATAMMATVASAAKFVAPAGFGDDPDYEGFELTNEPGCGSNAWAEATLDKAKKKDKAGKPYNFEGACFTFTKSVIKSVAEKCPSVKSECADVKYCNSCEECDYVNLKRDQPESIVPCLVASQSFLDDANAIVLPGSEKKDDATKLYNCPNARKACVTCVPFNDAVKAANDKDNKDEDRIKSRVEACKILDTYDKELLDHKECDEYKNLGDCDCARYNLRLIDAGKETDPVCKNADDFPEFKQCSLYNDKCPEPPSPEYDTSCIDYLLNNPLPSLFDGPDANKMWCEKVKENEALSACGFAICLVDIPEIQSVIAQSELTLDFTTIELDVSIPDVTELLETVQAGFLSFAGFPELFASFDVKDKSKVSKKLKADLDAYSIVLRDDKALEKLRDELLKGSVTTLKQLDALDLGLAGEASLDNLFDKLPTFRKSIGGINFFEDLTTEKIIEKANKGFQSDAAKKIKEEIEAVLPATIKTFDKFCEIVNNKGFDTTGFKALIADPVKFDKGASSNRRRENKKGNAAKFAKKQTDNQAVLANKSNAAVGSATSTAVVSGLVVGAAAAALAL